MQALHSPEHREKDKDFKTLKSLPALWATNWAVGRKLRSLPKERVPKQASGVEVQRGGKVSPRPSAAGRVTERTDKMGTPKTGAAGGGVLAGSGAGFRANVLPDKWLTGWTGRFTGWGF